MARNTKIPFSWKKHFDSLQKKNEYRVARLAVTNIDFKIRHPNIQREVAKNDGALGAEGKLFCKEKCEKQLKKGLVPVPERPVRLNRVE